MLWNTGGLKKVSEFNKESFLKSLNSLYIENPDIVENWFKDKNYYKDLFKIPDYYKDLYVIFSTSLTDEDLEKYILETVYSDVYIPSNYGIKIEHIFPKEDHFYKAAIDNGVEEYFESDYSKINRILDENENFYICDYYFVKKLILTQGTASPSLLRRHCKKRHNFLKKEV